MAVYGCTDYNERMIDKNELPTSANVDGMYREDWKRLDGGESKALAAPATSGLWESTVCYSYRCFCRYGDVAVVFLHQSELERTAEDVFM